MYFPAVDGLRALAVLSVIAFHLSESRVPGAFLGVDVFFVISGFVITTTLLRERENTGRLSLWQFYRRRWWRLAPAQAAVIIMGLPLVLISGVQPVLTWGREAVLGATYTYNIGQAALGDPGSTMLNHLWSLSLEEQFYLFWPPLLALVLACVGGPAHAARHLTVVLVVLVVFFAVTRVVTALAAGNLVAFFVPWSRFDEFLVGALVAVALHAGMLTAFFRSLWPALAAGVLLVALVPFTRIFESDWLYAGGFLGVAVAAAVVVGHLCVSESSVLIRLLRSGLLVWIGKRSYGIYLYHLPLIVTLYSLDAPRWVYGTAGPAAAVTLAALSYRWLEVPLRRRGRRRTRPCGDGVEGDVPRTDQARGTTPDPGVVG